MQRSYDVLIEKINFNPHDIIDPNIFAVATGIEEHDNYAVDFIEATRWIKSNFSKSFWQVMYLFLFAVIILFARQSILFLTMP